MNELTTIRSAMSMNEGDFGQQILGISDRKQAYDTVYNLERSESHLATTNLAIRLLYHALRCKTLGIEGCDGFLDYVLVKSEGGEL